MSNANLEALAETESQNGSTAQEIAKLQEINLTHAGAAVQAVLDDFNVNIVAAPQIQDGKIVAVIQLVNR